jgi:hypothetical protein
LWFYTHLSAYWVFVDMLVRILTSIAVAIASGIFGAWIFLLTAAGLLVGGGPGGGLLPFFATFVIALACAIAAFVICFGWLGKRSTRARARATRPG